MKYIIVGAVAGGASTAARLRRLDEDAEIVIFEKGEYISYANCGLPYYIGDVIKDRNKLFVQTAAAFNKRFNIDVRVRTEVTDIDPIKKLVVAFNHETGTVYTEHFDKLVLSPGADPIRPPFNGINLPGIFTLRNVTDTDYIKAYVDEHKSGNAVVIGGGFIGLEMAENLHHLGMKVTIVEKATQVLAPVDFPIAAIAQQHIRSKGVDLKLNVSVAEFEKNGDKLAVALDNGEALSADVVILSIGVKPDVRLAKSAGIRVGEAGGIYVNEFLQTSHPDIYAVGDAIEFANPITGVSMPTYLAGPANKQGRLCADNIVYGNTRIYKGAYGTAIVKLFDMTFAATGLASKHLARANMPHRVSTTTSGHHAGYYPGAASMTIQLTFAADTGKLLGAQIAGFQGVDKRIDVLAATLRNKGTIYDLAEFEHAYAPPFSSAKDPVNMAGFVAENIMTNRLKVLYWNEVADLGENDVLIDVRAESEFAQGHIPGAQNIPVDELRSRLNEVPRNKNIVIYCQIGLRGYLAQRILTQKGFSGVRNISGGYGLYKVCIAEQEQA